MQVLVFTLLLAISAPGAEPPAARALVFEGHPAQARPIAAPDADPCALARRIVRQRPCLGPGDCRSLQLWKRSFGAPRFEPADPNRGFVVHRGPPGSARPWTNGRPEPERRLRPGTVCPAPGEKPRR